MLEKIPTSSGLLFASFLYRSDLHSEEELRAFWEAQFGESFFYSPEFNPLTKYYNKEMGENLSRFFIVPKKPFKRDQLLLTKLESLNWEKNWAIDSKRMVNIDIGFISPENFILATTKNYSHRIYLGEDIFADLTYYFHEGKFQTLPWTYPDYVDEKKIELFTWLRSFLLAQR
ncbi:MAG: DUF4416 family protein [Bacteriovoracaceae bacterium]